MGAKRWRQAGKNGVSAIGRYIYRPIDSHASLFFMVDEKQLARWQAPYAQLRGLLAQADWISEGYVQDRGSPLFPVEFNSVRDQH